MGDSSWLNNRLSHPDYNNWVKGNLILRELKTGLVPFLDDKARDLQQYVLRHVPASSLACTVCTGDVLRRGRYVCPSAGICTTLLQVINTEYTHHPPGTVKLVNTDNQAWCDTARYWEIVKAYISTPGYASKMSAAETDCVGLLTILINCTWIQSFLAVGTAVVQQIKDVRNAMMHSEDSTMTSGELDDLFDGCVQVLQDSRYFVADLTAQGALDRIREIKDKTLTLSGIDLPVVMFIIDEVKAHQEKDSEAIGNLEARSAALETDSQNLKVWQQLAEKRMEELAKQQTKQQQDMSQLDARVKRQRTEHQQGVSHLDTMVSQLDTRVKRQRTEHQQVTSQLDTTVSQLDTTVSQLDTTVSQLDTTVSQLDTRVSRQHAEHQQAMSELDTLVKRERTEHQQEISKLDTTVSQLDTTVSQLDTTVSQLDTTVSQLDTRVSRQHAEHQQAMSERDAHISNLEVRKSTESSHMIEGQNKLKSYLLELYRNKILQREPNVWFPMKDVLQMVVPLEIRGDLERWMALSRTDRKKERTSKARDGTKLKSKREMFFKGLERQYEIYLLGEAGVGKSTFCHQLIDNWCKVQDTESNDEYLRVLKSFSFLFFIQARYAKKSQSVYEMIQTQNCPLKFRSILEEVFTSHPENCLVLIDGLDEWQSGTNGYQELPNVIEIEGSTILITSRQWRIEALDCELPYSCRVLEIQGLNSGGIKNLAGRALEAFTKEDNQCSDCESLVRQFLDQICALKLVKLAKIPLILLILLRSWLDGNRKLENAHGFIYSGLIESLLIHSDKKVKLSKKWCDSTNLKNLPMCFSERGNCLDYNLLINELAKLAFDHLFSAEKENTLVIRKHDLAKQPKVEEHLQMCLKLGLLIESKDFSETRECHRAFSFPHKTIQEFFCAVYLSGEKFETGLAKFYERVTSPVDVFAFGNVILFLSGMNLTHCKTLFEHICSIVFCRKFAHGKLYPVGWYMLDKVAKIEKLAEHCIAEARHSVPEGSHTGESQFVIPDMDVRLGTPEHKVGQFCSLGLNIKSLVYDIIETPLSVVESVKTMQHIQRLGIGCTAANTEKHIVCICKYLSNLHQLKSFSFSVVCSTVRLSRLSIHASTELVSKLGTLPNLVSVFLQRLDLSDFDTCQLTSQLTSLGLEYTKSLSSGFVSGWCNRLHTLYMSGVYLSPGAVDQLCQYVKTSSSLQSLTVSLLSDNNHPNHFSPFYYTLFYEVLDLTSHTSLHTLELSSICLHSGVRIHPGHNWRKIDMYTVSMSEYMWQEFIQNLSTEPLQQLYVKLWSVKSLNTQTISYIRDKFCVTKEGTHHFGTYSDSIDSDSIDSDSADKDSEDSDSADNDSEDSDTEDSDSADSDSTPSNRKVIYFNTKH